MWLDFNGIPLKWHYPIGVLYDIYSPDIKLPWNITVHFSKFPEKEILHCQCRETVESHFMSCIKEADVLKHRSQVVSSMQKKDHNQLWLGLQNGKFNLTIKKLLGIMIAFCFPDKFDQFWAVNRKLMEASGEDSFKYIPFRCYHGDESYTQKLVKPLTEEGQRKTLQNLVDEVFSGKSENGNFKTSLRKFFFPKIVIFILVKIFTHGIEPPRETPLQWMSEHLSYPDNFLHLVCATT